MDNSHHHPLANTPLNAEDGIRARLLAYVEPARRLDPSLTAIIARADGVVTRVNPDTLSPATVYPEIIDVRGDLGKDTHTISVEKLPARVHEVRGRLVVADGGAVVERVGGRFRRIYAGSERLRPGSGLEIIASAAAQEIGARYVR
ncbi:hypothetical protein ACFHW2_41010 [Actinomadura sp. LOL_016]|uniref:hypothetical protein n=1 Tax=unclassified Actinomadura TaxID=2626254 RepID=UPI003A8066A4